MDVAHAQGAAWRHRQRRQRAHAPGHVRSPRRPTGWERDVLHGQVPEHPTLQAAGTEYFSLDVVDVPAAGSRPDRLFAVSGPQDWVQRRTVQQIVDIAPLPILDDPAPQMVEQLPDVLRFFRALSPDPEQVIEVPTFLPEVPTIVSWALLQQNVEQNVDIPVVDRGSGAGGGLSGFLPGQYSLTAE